MASVQEFSAKVKEKYPEYSEVDDLELARKIVEKYPEYKDQVVFDAAPALNPAPPASRFERVKNFLTGKPNVPAASSPADRLPPSAMDSRIEEARTRDTPISRTARKPEKTATQSEALAALERYKLDDEALAALIRPDAPESVTGVEIQDKRAADYNTALRFGESRRAIAKLGKPSLTPKPLPDSTPTDVTAVAAKPTQAAQAIPAPALEPKPLEAAAPADASTVPTAAPEVDPVIAKEAKLVERAQSLAEALPSFGKGVVKGATAGLVDPTDGTEGAPGGLGQIAGNLAGGAAAGLAGPVGAPVFLMTQFLTDLEERGLDPARMADPEILALAATSGLLGGATPVAFGKGVLKRALTGAGLGAAQNVAEEDIMAAVTDTEPERLKALILGGAFGAGFGAAFRDNPKVREAVAEKLPAADVKAMDEVLAEAAPTPEPAVVTEAAPEVKPDAEVGAEAPVVEQAAVPAQAAEVQPAAEPAPAVQATPLDVAPAPTQEAPRAEAPKAAEMDPGVEAQRLWREKKTESPHFKKWFGESKVVDDEGKPLVVYHGGQSDFGEFKSENVKATDRYEGGFGYYFTSDADHASAYADLDNADVKWNPKSKFAKPSKEGANVMPVFVKSENPMIVETKGLLEAELDGNGASLVKKAREAGHDALIVRRRNGDEFDGDAIVAFSPTQIKSAIGNTGKFDPKNPSITDSHPGKPFGETPEGIVRAPEPDEMLTSTKNAMTARDRAALGFDELPSPERESKREWRKKALEEGYHHRAEEIADEIIASPRGISKLEDAGIRERMHAVKLQHEAAYNNYMKLDDPIKKVEQMRAIMELESSLEKLSRATKLGGTETARDLASRAGVLDRGFKLAEVFVRAKEAKGAEISPQARKIFEEYDAKLKDAESKLAEAIAKNRDLEARGAIRERRATTKRKPVEVKAQIADLTEKTRRLLRAGCLTS